MLGYAILRATFRIQCATYRNWPQLLCCRHWLGFHVFSTEQSQTSRQNGSARVAEVFERLQHITTLERFEVVFLSSFLSWLWFFKLVWKSSSNSSKFSDFPSKVGIFVLRDLGSFGNLMLLLLKLTALVLLDKCCWRANKNWLPSIVTGLFSLRKCGWLGERTFFCLPEEAPREQFEIFLEFLSPFERSLPRVSELKC